MKKKLSKAQVRAMEKFDETQRKFEAGDQYTIRYCSTKHNGKVWFRAFGVYDNTLEALVRLGVLEKFTEHKNDLVYDYYTKVK